MSSEKRRAVLKSAGAWVAASSVGLPGAAAAQGRSAAPSATAGAGSAAVRTPPFHSQMIGFVLSHEQFPAQELVPLAPLAEQAGFDLISTSDHFQPWQSNERHSGEAWVTLGAASQHTRHIWMGTMVTCPTLRYHPAVVAEAFTTLSLLAPGRIYLGVGSGEALNEQAATGQWPAWRERWDRLIEALAIMRELWGGRAVKHKGRIYEVEATLYDRPPQPIPLLTAANGPKAMRLAGEHGDGLITDPETWMQARGEWEAGVRASGRQPADLPVMAELFVVVGGEREAQQPAELWRFLPKAFKGYHNSPDPAEIQRRADQEIPIQKLLSSWVVSSDPEAHVRKVKELYASGVTAVNIHRGQQDQHRVIDFYARQVLPQLKSTATTTARH